MTINRAETATYQQRIAALVRDGLDTEARVPSYGNDPHWVQYVPHLMARAGVDRAYLDQYCNPPQPKLPPGAGKYLHSSNARLAELKHRYRLVDSPVVHHSLWNAAYVDADLPLQRFRGDCAFMWQQRDLNLPSTYLLTYYYLCALGNKVLLDRLSEDDLFGVHYVQADGTPISRDRLDSAVEIAFLDRVLGISQRPSCRILDIGSGYGRLAYRLTQAFENVSVICVDAVAESTFLCEYYLQFRGVTSRVQVIPLTEIEEVLAENYVDIAVNVHSFSECPSGAIRWWLDLLTRAQVPQMVIVPNTEWHGGTKLLSFELDGCREDFRPLLEERSYRLAMMQPKYEEATMQQFGVTPTHYFLFRR